jgi:cytidylate kinase
MEANGFAVAIDGPGGAGKSTVARQVAARLNMLYVDTGAMYRAIGLYNIRSGNDIHNQTEVNKSLPKINIELNYIDGGQRLLLNGEDVTEILREQPIAKSASVVAAYYPVREFLVALQQKIALNGRVVMDGRDIGTHVMPWAQMKIYLDACLEERVRRRITELKKNGLPYDAEQVKREMETRDEMDMNRTVAPLIKADDAVYIDSSNLTLEQVINKIEMLIISKLR